MPSTGRRRSWAGAFTSRTHAYLKVGTYFRLLAKVTQRKPIPRWTHCVPRFLFSSDEMRVADGLATAGFACAANMEPVGSRSAWKIPHLHLWLP